MNDFGTLKVSPQPLMRLETVETYPPFFLGGDLLSGMDSGRDRLIGARFGLGRNGEKSGSLSRFPKGFEGSLEPHFHFQDQERLRANLGGWRKKE